MIIIFVLRRTWTSFLIYYYYCVIITTFLLYYYYCIIITTLSVELSEISTVIFTSDNCNLDRLCYSDNCNLDRLCYSDNWLPLIANCVYNIISKTLICMVQWYQASFTYYVINQEEWGFYVVTQLPCVKFMTGKSKNMRRSLLPYLGLLWWATICILHSA